MSYTAEQTPTIHKMSNSSQTHELVVTIHVVSDTFSFYARQKQNGWLYNALVYSMCLLFCLMFPAKAAAHHTNSHICLSPLSTHLHRPVLLPAVHTVLVDQRAVQRLVVL